MIFVDRSSRSFFDAAIQRSIWPVQAILSIIKSTELIEGRDSICSKWETAASDDNTEAVQIIQADIGESRRERVINFLGGWLKLQLTDSNVPYQNRNEGVSVVVEALTLLVQITKFSMAKSSDCTGSMPRGRRGNGEYEIGKIWNISSPWRTEKGGESHYLQSRLNVAMFKSRYMSLEGEMHPKGLGLHPVHVQGTSRFVSGNIEKDDWGPLLLLGRSLTEEELRPVHQTFLRVVESLEGVIESAQRIEVLGCDATGVILFTKFLMIFLSLDVSVPTALTKLKYVLETATGAIRMVPIEDTSGESIGEVISDFLVKIPVSFHSDYRRRIGKGVGLKVLTLQYEEKLERVVEEEVKEALEMLTKRLYRILLAAGVSTSTGRGVDERNEADDDIMEDSFEVDKGDWGEDEDFGAAANNHGRKTPTLTQVLSQPSKGEPSLVVKSEGAREVEFARVCLIVDPALTELKKMVKERWDLVGREDLYLGDIIYDVFFLLSAQEVII